MKNGQAPLSSDLDALILQVGGITLESSEPVVLSNEQWVTLPARDGGFVCAIDAPAESIAALTELLVIINDANAVLHESQQGSIAREEMERLAMLDPLTELPNRRKLFDCLGDILQRKTHNAILQIDLDRFKQINDSLGHAAGDEVLVVVANRLSANVRPGDLVVRIGGDEFVVVCPEISDEQSMIELADRLIESLNQPMRLEGHHYDIGVSIGIAFSKADEFIAADTLLQNADLALYTSKVKGRNQFHLYEPLMRTKFDSAQSMKKELSKACENGSIIAHFQPTFCMQSRMVAGIQAMARWQHSSFGLMSYSQFEHHADEKVLRAIDREMFNQCLKGIRTLSDSNAEVSKFSITAPMIRLREADSVTFLQSETKRHDLSPTHISLEIVEDGNSVEEDKVLMENLERLRDAGYGISLSNFGGAHSNFQSLLHIQPHSLKLDATMCRELANDKPKQRLVKSIVHMAEQMNAAVVATVVEKMEDFDILANLNCNLVQGNIMYPPSDITFLAKWLQSESAAIIKVA